MSPEDVLRVATTLKDLAQEREGADLNSEAELRSAVSRAYYAAPLIFFYNQKDLKDFYYDAMTSWRFNFCDPSHFA
jgi:hypothetical protein